MTRQHFPIGDPMASRTSSKKRPESVASENAGSATDSSQAAIWGRLIQPDRDDLSPDAARSLLGVTFGDEDRLRAHELATKNQEDALSSEEQNALRNYREVSYFLDLLHAKCRLSLKKHSS
jgi:hypothetical protein